MSAMSAMRGHDKGEGGKFLVLPPGYEGDVPEGYFVFESKTYGVWLALRASLSTGRRTQPMRSTKI